MKIQDLKQGQTIFFKNEIPGMHIKAINECYAVCLRELHIEYDKDILEHEVRREAFSTIEDAYAAARKWPIYTCLGFDEKIKGAHNLVFNLYDFDTPEGCEKLVTDLSTGDTEISHRNRVELEIDWTRTAEYNKL